eukprot:jgi/Mesvir1/25101/Mv21565-RA.1
MWRKFQFFERAQEDVSNEIFSSNISCAAAGHGRLIFGTSDGLVHVVERGFQLRGTFRAYGSSVSHICQLKHSNLLVTLGENESTPGTAVASTSIRLWDIAKCLASATTSAATASAEGTTAGSVSASALSAAGAAGGSAAAKAGPPVAACIRSVKLFSGKNFPESPITSFLVTEDSFPGHLLVAAGLANGCVYLLRGDVARDKAARSRLDVLSHGGSNAGTTTQYKVTPTVLSDSLHPGGSSNGGGDASTHDPYGVGVGAGQGLPMGVAAGSGQGTGMQGNQARGDVGGVTGVGVRLEARSAFLFATTVATTVVFNLGSLQMDKVVLDDSCGALPGRTVMSHTQELVVGRPEAFFFYDVDGRGPCFVFDGHKHKVAWFRGYLLAVVGDDASKATFNIYDLKSKLIAFSAHLGDVRHIMSEWGAVIVMTADRKVHTLTEKDLPSKLHMLFRKSLYSIAINLAQGSHDGAGGGSHNTADFSITADVLRMYGDHLYLKQDFDGAMAQYLQTIGWLEPSYVIRRFLDAQRISLLATYLDALHARGVATADHTTLLLNCYTKLKDVKKLDEFIRAEDEGAAGAAYNFDVATAVRVCRGAGYFLHALRMSSRAGLHREHLHILLDDVARYDEAVEYLHTLPLDEAHRAMRLYGKTLVKHRPHAATSLLMRLCDPQSVDPPTTSTASRVPGTAAMPLNAAASTSTVNGSNVANNNRLPEPRASFNAGAGRRRPADIDARLAAATASLPPPPVTSEDEDPFAADPWARPSVPAGTQSRGGYGGGGSGGMMSTGGFGGAGSSTGFGGAGFGGMNPSGGGGMMGMSSMDAVGGMGRGGAGHGVSADVDEVSGRGVRGERETTGLPMAAPPPRPPRQVPSHAEFLGLFVDRPRALLLYLEKALPMVQGTAGEGPLTNTLLELYLMPALVDGGAAERPLPLASVTLGPAPATSSSRLPSSGDGAIDTNEVAATGGSEKHARGGDGGGHVAADGMGGAGGSGSMDGSSSAGGLVGEGASVGGAMRTGKTLEGGGAGASGGDGQPDADFEQRRAKGMELLVSGWPPQKEPVYDADLALMLCQMHRCRDGRLFLLERLRMYRDVLAAYMEDDDSEGLILACKRLADPSRGGQPNLWVDVLTYFSNQDRDCSSEVAEVLRHVERDDLLPPLLVLHTLSRNKRLSLAVVKDYVTRHIQRENALVEADAADIRKYKEETAAMKKEVAEISTQPRIFQLTKCTACTAVLDLPAVHFLCMHSYHQRCLNENERECPTCAPAARTVMEIKRNLDQSVGDHDTFFKHLQSADDGFSVVADYFGRGVINKARGTSAAASAVANRAGAPIAPTMLHGPET